MSSVSPAGWQSPVEVAGVVPTTSASPPPAPYLQGTLDGVAGMLSMSTDALRSALKQGSSISDLAAQKGVDRNSILRYVEQQVQQRRAADGKQPISQQVLADVVGRALDRHRGGHGHRHVLAAQQPTSGLDALA